MARFTIGLGILLVCTPASADWVVFTNGQRTRIQSIEIGERAVHITTLAGGRWSVVRDSVDVDATRAANGTPAPTEALEVVTVEDTPPILPEPPPPPAVIVEPSVRETPSAPVSPAPPPQSIVERELTPVPPTSDVFDTSEPAVGAPRLAIAINGVQSTDASTFADSSQFELFREQASIESIYRDGRRQGYELGIQYRFWGPLAAGATVQRFDTVREATYTASLPHPFFFDRFREASGASGLTNEELAVHANAVVTRTWGPLTVDAFAGPSWFHTRTEMIVAVQYEELFPYDEVFLQGVEGRIVDSQPFGYNVGGSATFRIAGIFGVDVGARYSDARSKLFVEDGRAIELDVGGLNVSAGLRFLFP